MLYLRQSRPDFRLILKLLLLELLFLTCSDQFYSVGTILDFFSTMEQEVQEFIPKLTASVEMIMNPATSQADRLQAHQVRVNI